MGVGWFRNQAQGIAVQAGIGQVVENTYIISSLPQLQPIVAYWRQRVVDDLIAVAQEMNSLHISSVITYLEFNDSNH